MKIIPVDTDPQIQQVAELAAEIWTQHFTPIIGAAQVEYMLETVQSAESIGQSIREQGYQYRLMRVEDQFIGYFSYQLQEGRVFLSKLYLKADCRGKGYARQAMERIEAIGRTHGAADIWLTVNKHNTHVIAIYEKMGYTIEGPIVQDIGGGFIMDDYKMVKPIRP